MQGGLPWVDFLSAEKTTKSLSCLHQKPNSISSFLRTFLTFTEKQKHIKLKPQKKKRNRPPPPTPPLGRSAAPPPAPACSRRPNVAPPPPALLAHPPAAAAQGSGVSSSAGRFTVNFLGRFCWETLGWVESKKMWRSVSLLTFLCST